MNKLITIDDQNDSANNTRTVAHRSPQKMLSLFTHALDTNRLLLNKVEQLRFTFVEVMESAAERTDPLKAENRGENSPYAVEMTWPNLVARMLTFVSRHNYELEWEHSCVSIFKALTAHLLKVRANEDGSLFDPMDEDDDSNGNGDNDGGGEDSDEDDCGDEGVKKARNLRVLAELEEKQNALDGQGVTRVVLVALITHPAGVSDNLADVGCELLSELIR